MRARTHTPGTKWRCSVSSTDRSVSLGWTGCTPSSTTPASAITRRPFSSRGTHAHSPARGETTLNTILVPPPWHTSIASATTTTNASTTNLTTATTTNYCDSNTTINAAFYRHQQLTASTTPPPPTTTTITTTTSPPQPTPSTRPLRTGVKSVHDVLTQIEAGDMASLGLDKNDSRTLQRLQEEYQVARGAVC